MDCRFPSHRVLCFSVICLGCGIWMTLCWLFAHLNINCGGGRSRLGWLVTLVPGAPGSPKRRANRGTQRQLRAFACPQAFADEAGDSRESDIPCRVFLAKLPRRHRDATTRLASLDDRTCPVPRPSRRGAAIPECRRCRFGHLAGQPRPLSPASVLWSAAAGLQHSCRLAYSPCA